MRRELILASCLCLICMLANAQVHEEHEHVMLIDFDASCMKKFKYKVDKEFIIDDNHTDIHVYLDAERTLVLKIMDKDEVLTEAPAEEGVHFDCMSLKTIDESFVVGINAGSNVFYLVERSPQSAKYYRISFAEYAIENNHHLSSFGPPEHSFIYEFNHDYEPMENLFPVAFYGFDYDTRIYYFGMEHEKQRDEYVFLCIYRDVCASRPYGLATPKSAFGEENPYKYADVYKDSDLSHLDNGGVNPDKKVMRSCQHPVHWLYIRGLGFIRKYYEEDGNIYKSELVSVDGIPIDDYLQNTPKGISAVHHHHPEAELTWEHKQTSSVLVLGTSVTPKKVSYIDMPVIPKPVKKPIEKTPKIPAKPINVPKGRKGDFLVHVVRKGDTLYNISKRYNMKIEKIKQINQLTSNKILIGAELYIK